MSPATSTAALALDVTVTAGANAGTRIRFAEPPVTFGRGESHPLVIDLPAVSRDHGFFDIRDGQWVIANRSPNGLKLNGRRLTGKKTRVLPAAAEVTIGDDVVMALRLRDAAADAGAEGAARAEQDGDDADPMHRPRWKVTRTRLLVGLVAFWVVLFGVLFALEPILNRNDTPGRDAALPVARLDVATIDQWVRAAPAARPDDTLAAEDALRQAESFYALRDVKPDAPFRAMDAYRRAASYLPGNTLPDPLAQRRYLDLQRELSEEMARRYTDALAKLDSRRYDAALRALDEILERFPDYDRGDRSLHRHAQKLRDYARKQARPS